MPLTPKGTKIKSAMQEHYGSEKGERVFYASKNAGKIKGVDTKTRITHSRAVPGLGRTTVTHTNDTTNTVDSWFRDGNGDKGGPLVTGGLPVPERQKDLLGEVSKPETTPRGPMKSAPAPESNKKSGDAKKAKDQSSTAGTPMNNLGMGIPSPNISGHPGTSTSTSTGDSLRGMNQANRAFWARKR